MAEERKRIPFWTILAAGLVLAGLGYWAFHQAFEGGRRMAGSDILSVGGPFDLIDQSNQPLTDKDFRGHFFLITFGYTYSVNPTHTTLTRIGEALDILGPDGQRIIPLLVTVDPERDTPPQLAMYVRHFHRRLIGLTGAPERIAAIAKAYQISYSKAGTATADPQDYAMDYTPIIYLMDPEGNPRIPINPSAEPAEMAERIRKALQG